MTDTSLFTFTAAHWTRVWVVGCVILACWGGVGAWGQPRPDVTSWVKPDTIRGGETFTLNVTASTPAHRKVWFPEADADSSVFGELTVLRRSKMYSRPVGVMYALDSVAYTVTTSALDSVRVPPIPVRVDAGIDTVETHTQPFAVPIAAGGGQTVLRGVNPDSAPGGILGWGLLGIVVAAGLGGIYAWRHVETKPAGSSEPTVSKASESASSPYETAREKLDHLRTRDRGKEGDVESIYVTLTGVVRAYLSRRLNIPARESTTSELIAGLRAHDEVPTPAADRLQSILEEADLVKFAGVRPDTAVAREHITDAQAALDAIEDAAQEEDEPSRH